MNCTGLHSDFHATLEQSRRAMAKVARLATESQAECERMQKRIAALEYALKTMVDHACEMYPHFESERGQRDIEQARNALKG